MKALGILLAVAVFVTTSAQAVFSQEANQDSDTAYRQYEYQKVDPWGPFVLNLLLPFGIGSFVQGDTTGGLLVAGGQVVGVGLMLVDLGRPQEVDEYGLPISNEPTAMTWIGAGLYSVATVAALIFPFTYANAANEKLRRDLGITVSDVSVSEDGLNITLAVALP